jgi:hypothetical protein
MIQTLCRRIDADAMMAHLSVFAQRVKLSGTPEEWESFRYLEQTLAGYGYSTRLLRHDAYISLPGSARVETQDGALHCITHSFSRPSPTEGLRGDLVYVGAGRPADFAKAEVVGKVALIEGLAAPGPSARASMAGAIGQIHISPHEHRHEMCISREHAAGQVQNARSSSVEEMKDSLARQVEVWRRIIEPLNLRVD